MSYDFGAYRDFAYVAAVFRARQEPYPTLTPTLSPTPTPTGTPQQGWERASYTYSSTHPHAVTSVERSAGTDTFGYDAVGSMTSRIESSVSWTQTFNAEGRLSQISDGSDTWTFTHDGDGVRLKQANPDGTTTLFLGGGLYEVTLAGDGSTSSVKRYYAIAGQRVLRDGEGLHYLLTDHLGSIVGVLDGNGDIESEQRYLPYGGPRYSPDIAETDFAFTGQRSLEAVGLMDYNARWYSPIFSRFISADMVIPELANPQSLNRYSYTRNNPLRFTDPTGFYEFADSPDEPYWPFTKSSSDEDEMSNDSPASSAQLGGLREDSGNFITSLSNEPSVQQSDQPTKNQAKKRKDEVVFELDLSKGIQRLGLSPENWDKLGTSADYLSYGLDLYAEGVALAWAFIGGIAGTPGGPFAVEVSGLAGLAWGHLEAIPVLAAADQAGRWGFVFHTLADVANKETNVEVRLMNIDGEYSIESSCVISNRTRKNFFYTVVDILAPPVTEIDLVIDLLTILDD
jgi:RHS repeat-associated protein